jgi:hypothetical protein
MWMRGHRSCPVEAVAADLSRDVVLPMSRDVLIDILVVEFDNLTG